MDGSLENDCFIVSTVNMVLQNCNLPRALWNVIAKCFIQDFVITEVRISGCKQKKCFWGAEEFSSMTLTEINQNF